MDVAYDLCVIGAGTAGFAAAEVARTRQRSVILVTEEGDLGGTCIRRGCMPAKTLLGSTERLAEVERSDRLGVLAERGHVDLRAVVARKDALVEYFAAERTHELETYPLLRGSACFVAPDTVLVGGRRITARTFVIATGSRIAHPPIAGLDRSAYFTSDDALEMTRVPASLIVLGGGPVGCEFAQYFARLGARVTLVESSATLLRKEDPDIGSAIARALEDDGVDVRVATEVVAARTGGTLQLRDERGTYDLRADAIMLASHRLPNLDALALEVAGVTASPTGIVVTPTLRTTNPRIFAAGDVLGRRCLVHVAEYAGRIAATNALDGSEIVAELERFEAHAVYTQPQVAVAGLTETACRERGIAYAVRRHPFADVGKAVVSDEAVGFVKMLAAADGRVLGVAIVGMDAIDLIGEAIVAIDAGATTQRIAAMPHLHPTMGEIYVRVAERFLASDTPRELVR